MADLMTKIPFDVSHIIAKIKDSDFFKGITKKKEIGKNGKIKSIKEHKTGPDGSFQSLPTSELRDNLVNKSS
jgi:hypothetical protein